MLGRTKSPKRCISKNPGCPQHPHFRIDIWYSIQYWILFFVCFKPTLTYQSWRDWITVYKKNHGQFGSAISALTSKLGIFHVEMIRSFCKGRIGHPDPVKPVNQ